MDGYKLLTTCLLILAVSLPCRVEPAEAKPKKEKPIASKESGPALLPYVYTKWKSYTVKDGLPNDHIFAVKAHGPSASDLRRRAARTRTTPQPLMTPMGRMRATFRASPADATHVTTSSTSL